jgi:AIG1 family
VVKFGGDPIIVLYCNNVSGKDVLVVDTPGLFDTSAGNFEIMETIRSCVKLSLPGTNRPPD